VGKGKKLRAESGERGAGSRESRESGEQRKNPP